MNEEGRLRRPAHNTERGRAIRMNRTNWATERASRHARWKRENKWGRETKTNGGPNKRKDDDRRREEGQKRETRPRLGTRVAWPYGCAGIAVYPGRLTLSSSTLRLRAFRSLQ
jgi:hypothetical protein